MTSRRGEFEEGIKGFFDRYLELEPVEATRLGDHRFDARWPAIDDAERMSLATNELGELADAERRGGSTEQERVDAAIVANRMRYLAFERSTLRPIERDPMALTGLVGDGLDPLVTRTFAAPEIRARSLTARLHALPELLDEARRFTQETPAISTATAIEQNVGLVDLCETQIFGAFAGLDASAAGALGEAAARGAEALRRFGRYLTDEAAPESKGSFRLGRQLFEQKLRLELDHDVDIDAIAEGARELLERTQDEMAETAARAWSDLAPGESLPPTRTRGERLALVRRALDLVAIDRPTDRTIVAEASRLLEETTRFVRDRDLVRVPDEPCRVIEMPEYRRGFSIAYCDPSGPLEPKPETFYAIAPTPAGWSPERVASFYREYNRSMLVDLTVHEAMPGHFLQLMHAASCPSLTRAIFMSGAFAEGWAVYSEWLMAKHGFGGAKVELMRQKMVLRLSVNALLDHGVHAGDLDEARALDLMRNEAFQEEGEAVGKWRRACLSSAQLTTYYYGFTEMMKLRAEAEAEPGFNERAWHDRLLSFGSPSPRHVRTLLEAKAGLPPPR